MNFTGSTFEYMMQHNNSHRQKVEAERDALPFSHPCHGCAYAKGTPCIGYCMKKILDKKRGEETR